jgi:hypothetical protein
MIHPIPADWIVNKDSDEGMSDHEFRPHMVCLADVVPEPIEWLWPGRIALGKLSLIVGVPGLGKSMTTLDMAARVSTGAPWPPNLPGFQQKRTKPGGVVLMGCEDNLNDTIQPRLVAAAADLSRINALISAKYKNSSSKATEETSIDLKTHLPVIEQAIKRTPNCRLVVLDPISGYLAGIDSYKDSEVRPVLTKLSAMAAKYHIAIVAVAHLNKSDSKSAIDRTSGSIAFVAAARSVWGVVEDHDDEEGDRRLFLPIKNNLGNDRSGLAYSIKQPPGAPGGKIEWIEPVRVRIDDALGGKHEKGPDPVKRKEAEAFLKSALAGGRRLAAELIKEAQEAGIAEKTLRTAKKELGIRSYQEPRLGPHYWELPLVGVVPPIKTTKPTKPTKPPKESPQKS